MDWLILNCIYAVDQKSEAGSKLYILADWCCLVLLYIIDPFTLVTSLGLYGYFLGLLKATDKVLQGHDHAGTYNSIC